MGREKGPKPEVPAGKNMKVLASGTSAGGSFGLAAE